MLIGMSIGMSIGIIIIIPSMYYNSMQNRVNYSVFLHNTVVMIT